MSRDDHVDSPVRRTPFEIETDGGAIIRGDIRVVSGDGESGEDGSAGHLIVICHGFKGFKDWGFFPYVSDRLARGTGAVVVSFNFSGSGIGPDLETFSDLEGFGHNTFSKEAGDLDTVLDAARRGWLGDVPVDAPRSVALIGHSRGAAAVTLVGARRPEVASVVTWAGIGSVYRYEHWFAESMGEGGVMEILNSRTGQRLPLYRDVLDDLQAHRAELDMEAAARRLGPRLLVVHGTADESVPVTDGHSLHRASGGGRLALIEGASHTMDASHPFPGTNPRLEEAIEVTEAHLQRWLGEDNS
jgi:pimeloyl-ACP methyl ester carboxylesterase